MGMPTEQDKRIAFGRKMRGFRKMRAAIITDARKATPEQDPDLFDADKHLPPMPNGYARYRASKTWKAIEIEIRRQRGSVCERCGRYTRCNLFHTSAHRIIPHDPSAVVMLCQTCEIAKLPLKPAVVVIRELHQKENIRQASGLPRLNLERKKNDCT